MNRFVKKFARAITLLFIMCICVISNKAYSQVPFYKATFENGIKPEIGEYQIETKKGGTVVTINNPVPDNINNSKTVIKSTLERNSQTADNNCRAEYTSGKIVTKEKKIIYMFKIFMPNDFRTGLGDSYSMVLSQFKTNPCSNYGVEYGEKYDFNDEICWGMGSYNDFRIGPEYINYRLRAYPDCNELKLFTPTGRWVSYVIETYWTNSSNGYTKVYENGNLKYSKHNIKTLMDGFIEGECDVFWGLGLYSRLTEKESLSIYLDDIYIFDGDKYSVSEVCTICNEDEKECQQFNLTADIIDETNGQNNGSIDISIAEGNAPFTYQWSNGLNQEDLQNLSEGTYQLTITDNEGCNEIHQWTINNNEPNVKPVIQANYDKYGKSGAIISIDASESYDPNGDQLSYAWQIPEGIDVSSITGESIEFIAPFVEDSLQLEFILELTDTKEASIHEKFELTIKPLQCEEIDMNLVEASLSEEPNLPNNVLDNDTLTRWSANGIEEFIILSTTEPTILSNVGLSFFNRHNDSKALFDIYASQDGNNWVPLLSDLESCGFSNKMHVYNLPTSVQDKTYSFVKINGKGNTENTWNSYTEVKLFKPDTQIKNNPPVIKILLNNDN